MTKKILALLLALAVAMTFTVAALADGESDPTESNPTESNPDSTPDAPVVLTLDPNDGIGQAIEMEPDAEGKVVIPAKEDINFSKDNYYLANFTENADGSGAIYDFGQSITITEATTIYAYFIREGAEVVNCKVTYDGNGAEGEVIDEETYPAGGYAYTMFYDGFEYGDREFLGWNTKADGTGTMYEEDEAFEINEDVLLYAIWSEEEEEGGDDNDDPIIDDPTEEPEEDVTPTDIDDDNPKTGDAVATTVALAAGAVALGALIVLKKKD